MLKMMGLSRFQTSRATNTIWRLVLRVFAIFTQGVTRGTLL